MATHLRPNRNPWFGSCLRKKSFTRKVALEAVAAVKEKAGVTLYIYRCDNPSRRYHWHVTKENPRERKAAAS